MKGFLMILALILLALALPPAVKRKSWRWLLAALILSFIGVVLPLFIFFFSAFLSPESKSDCGAWLAGLFYARQAGAHAGNWC